METETPVTIPVLTAPYDWRPGCNYSGYNSKWCGKPAVYINGDLDMGGTTVEEVIAHLNEEMGGYRPFKNQFLCKRHLGTIRASESRRSYSRWNTRSTAYTDVWNQTFLDAYYSVLQERARISKVEYDEAEAKRQALRAERIVALIKEYDTEAEGYVAPATPEFIVVETESGYDRGRSIKVVRVGNAKDYDRDVITFEVRRSRVTSYSTPEPASIHVSTGYGSETALIPLCVTEVAAAAARAQKYLDAFQREFVAALKAGKETE